MSDETDPKQYLVMLLNMCNNFIGPVCSTLTSVKQTMDASSRRSTGGKRSEAMEDALAMLQNSSWQLERLRVAVTRYYEQHMPPCVIMRGSEPVAQAMLASNIMSYNVVPITMFTRAPGYNSDGSRCSWDDLRQPVNYIVYVMATGIGKWLCRAVCNPGPNVSLVGLKSTEDVDIPPGTRLKWLGRNIEVTLRTGVKSYAVVYVSENEGSTTS